MKTITLYHGSTNIIEKPIFGYGNPHNDYGLALYCSESIEMAKEWAVTDNENGYANEYLVDINNLNILDLADGNYNVLNWLAILLENRIFRVNSISAHGKAYILKEFLPDYKTYDVIKGYRADDSYFAFANAFLNNSMPIEVLYDVLMLGELGEQYAILSEKAFCNITFNGYHEADRYVYYPMKKTRDEAARRKYFEDYKNILNGTYMMDILREGWKYDDSRIRPIIY